jgi:hypothetical protein
VNAGFGQLLSGVLLGSLLGVAPDVLMGEF